MSKFKKIRTLKQLENAWEKYKYSCDNQTDTDSVSAAKKQQSHCVTYTIEGFCSFIGITRSEFYNSFSENPLFAGAVTRMKEECETDTRKKFELGAIPASLAALWMSRYGYSTKTDSNVSGSVPVVISGEDKLED